MRPLLLRFVARLTSEQFSYPVVATVFGQLKPTTLYRAGWNSAKLQLVAASRNSRRRFGEFPLSYTVRHQVFVSSTFTDLKAERAEVIQAIWELDCIPTGMEAFVASNDSQWDVIKRVIDECDYYVLILGGRYGSVTPEGISYTEKEFRYAKRIGLPVLAFTHSDPGQIVAAKTDSDTSLRDKMDKFREEIRATYPVKPWATASELGGVVSRSLVREIKTSPRPGWIRNDGTSPIALLEKINKLSEENLELRALQSVNSDTVTDERLEQGEDEITISGIRTIRDPNHFRYTQAWSSDLSWDAIFKDLGPSLISETTEGTLRKALASYQSLNSIDEGWTFVDSEVDNESWAEVLVQLRALGLIEPGVKKRAISDRFSYWRITQKGDRHLVSLLARRRGDAQ